MHSIPARYRPWVKLTGLELVPVRWCTGKNGIFGILANFHGQYLSIYWSKPKKVTDIKYLISIKFWVKLKQKSIKIYVFFRKIWAKNQNILKIWKLILFCIHFTQNFMLILNLWLFLGLLQYIESYWPWKFGQNTKNDVFWTRFAMVTFPSKNIYNDKKIIFIN